MARGVGIGIRHTGLMIPSGTFLLSSFHEKMEVADANLVPVYAVKGIAQ